MQTRSEEISQALEQIAFLDPTGLLRAVQVSLERTVNAWARILPVDATCAEIVEAADQLHRNHPNWEIRAGEVAKQIADRKRQARARAVQRREQARRDYDDESDRRLTPEEIEIQLAKLRRKL